MEKRAGLVMSDLFVPLAVIGLIIAFTLPGFIINAQKKEFAEKLDKDYRMLSLAFNSIVKDYDGYITSAPGFSSTTGSTEDSIKALNALAQKLSIEKNCGSNRGCWYTTPIKLLGNGEYTPNAEKHLDKKYAKAILKDGSSILVYIYNSSCTYRPNKRDARGGLYRTVCGELKIDINGKNAPNQIGRDVFGFWITKNGIYPWGVYNDGRSCDTKSTEWKTSYGCAAKVLSDKAMSY